MKYAVVAVRVWVCVCVGERLNVHLWNIQGKQDDQSLPVILGCESVLKGPAPFDGKSFGIIYFLKNFSFFFLFFFFQISDSYAKNLALRLSWFTCSTHSSSRNMALLIQGKWSLFNTGIKRKKKSWLLNVWQNSCGHVLETYSKEPVSVCVMFWNHIFPPRN